MSSERTRSSMANIEYVDVSIVFVDVMSCEKLSFYVSRVSSTAIP